MFAAINWPYAWLKKTGDRLATLLLSQQLPASTAIAAGKGTGAIDLLKVLAQVGLCSNHSACGTCSDCQQIEQDVHPGIFFADKPSIDTVRALSAQLLQTRSHSKFLIIDNIADIHIAASNALLKLCEEPPENTYIFIACAPESLLSTVRSRFTFFPLELSYEAGFFADMPLAAEQFCEKTYKKFLDGEKVDDPIYLLRYVYDHKPHRYFEVIGWLKNHITPASIYQVLQS